MIIAIVVLLTVIALFVIFILVMLLDIRDRISYQLGHIIIQLSEPERRFKPGDILGFDNNNKE